MSYSRSQAQREFDRWSTTYDGNPLQWFFFHPTHQMVLEMIAEPGGRILDVGCGTGQFAALALEHRPGITVTGLDLSRKMLAKAHGRLANGRRSFRMVQGDSHSLPFADGSFDIVTCAHSFHHYPDQARVVREMHRVLRPGGRVIIVDGDRDGLWGRFIFDGIVVAVEGPVKHLSCLALRQLLLDAGFDGIAQRRRGGFLPFQLTAATAVKREKARAA
jgi:ubiquinone/menaquinone biosynthesis C-methylase UbiE